MLYSHTIKLVRFYSGVDGLKTGFTEGAGYCLTATAKKNNMRLIAVVMGEADSTVRNSEVSAMLDYGYSQYELETLLSTESVIGRTEVDKGSKRYVDVVPKEDITFLNKKLEQKTNATYKVKMYNVKAPLKIGDEVGKILVYEDDEVIREVPITTTENIDKVNIFKLYFRYLGDIINSNISL